VRRWIVTLGVLVVVATVAVILVRRGEPSAAGPPWTSTTGTSAERTTGSVAGTSAAAIAPETAAPEPPAETTLPAAPTADPARFPTTVAVAGVAAIAVHDGPDGPTVSVPRSPAPYSGMPQIFVVVPTPDAPVGWLHVALRTRPNESTGWIRTADVGLDTHTWSIDINLSEHWATVYDAAEVFVSTSVVTGTDASPTPEGDSFVAEGVWTGAPGGVYGPYIYGLSSHSDVYTEFGGGDGQIGLHGTNQPGLLGTSASHGCVRFPNAVILRLANSLPMGVPVHIHR
jgi:lipoprotein-anchoring transpeptidase ErfK/SrfK